MPPANLNLDSTRYALLLQDETGSTPKPLPAGFPVLHPQKNSESATEGSPSTQSASSKHERATLNEAALRAKTEEGKALAKGDETEVTIVSGKSAAPEIVSIEWDDGQGQGISRNGKRKLDPNDEGSYGKKARSSNPPPKTESHDLRDVASQTRKIDCLVQVKTLEPARSLSKGVERHNIRLLLQGGEPIWPSIGLQFKDTRLDGKVVAEVIWGLDPRLGGQWIVQHFEYTLLQNAPNNKAVNHKEVVSRLKGDPASFGRLMCITLRLPPYALYKGGFYTRSARIGTTGAKWTCLDAIFKDKRHYNLRIWFLVPLLSPDLDEKCLSIMKYLFDHRRHPLAHIQDATGLSYGEWLAQQTNFTSLPRELRDSIYELTLSLGWRDGSVMRLEYLRECENGRYDDDGSRAYALLSTRISTSEIISEARQFFYQRNRFALRLWSNEIKEFVSDPDWSTARGCMQKFIVEPEDIRVESPAKLTRELNLLLGLSFLRTVTILILQYRIPDYSKYELRDALRLVAESCEELSGRLGDGLQFDLNLRCVEDEKGEWFGYSFMVVMECGLDRLKQCSDDLACVPETGLRPMSGNLIPEGVEK